MNLGDQFNHVGDLTKEMVSIPLEEYIKLKRDHWILSTLRNEFSGDKIFNYKFTQVERDYEERYNR